MDVDFDQPYRLVSEEDGENRTVRTFFTPSYDEIHTISYDDDVVIYEGQRDQSIENAVDEAIHDLYLGEFEDQYSIVEENGIETVSDYFETEYRTIELAHEAIEGILTDIDHPTVQQEDDTTNGFRHAVDETYDRIEDAIREYKQNGESLNGTAKSLFKQLGFTEFEKSGHLKCKTADGNLFVLSSSSSDSNMDVPINQLRLFIENHRRPDDDQLDL